MSLINIVFSNGSFLFSHDVKHITSPLHIFTLGIASGILISLIVYIPLLLQTLFINFSICLPEFKPSIFIFLVKIRPKINFTIFIKSTYFIFLQYFLC